MFEHRVTDDATGRSIRARVDLAGDDVIVIVDGGSRPHVGVVVLAQSCASPRKPEERLTSCTVLTIPPHKEEPVARPIAEAICTATGRTTVVTAGIHDDDLDAAGIAAYLELAQRLAADLPARLA